MYTSFLKKTRRRYHSRNFLTICIGGITGYAPVSSCKQNAGTSSTEVLRKLRGWHARREAYPCTTH